MKSKPARVEVRLALVVNGWQTVAPAQELAGMTLAQFKDGTKPSVDARQLIIDLDNQKTTATNQRDDADKVTQELILKVVNAVKGDPDLGEDSSLYEAMGYIRKSERKSGKTNKTKPQDPA